MTPLRQRNQSELEALRSCMDILDTIDKQAAQRIVSYLMSRANDYSFGQYAEMAAAQKAIDNQVEPTVGGTSDATR